MNLRKGERMQQQTDILQVFWSGNRNNLTPILLDE